MRALSRFISRCNDTLWLVRRLGYPWRQAWMKAGWWPR